MLLLGHVQEELSWRLPLEFVPHWAICITFFRLTFDSVNSFYKDHNEKDEYCISIQMYLSLGYLPEEKCWQSVKPAWIFDMASELLDPA